MEPVKGMKPSEYKVRDGFDAIYDQGITVAEKKWDGYSIHVIVDRTKKRQPLQLYSSMLNQMNVKAFPEFLDSYKFLPDGYYHGELVGKQATSMKQEIYSPQVRSSSNVYPDVIEKYPLEINVFDILFHEHEQVTHKPYLERRALLESIIQSNDTSIKLTEQQIVESAKGIEEYFTTTVDAGFEGLVVKHPDSLYYPGKRTKEWYKLKAFNTVDLALMGFFVTPESEQRGKPFAAAFGGVYNKDNGMIESLSKFKVGGIQDQEAIIEALEGRIERANYFQVMAKAEDSGFLFSDSMYESTHKKRKVPDMLVTKGDPVIVEVQHLGINYSKNSWTQAGKTDEGSFVLRMPTFVRLRDDKQGVEEINTVEDLHNLMKH